MSAAYSKTTADVFRLWKVDSFTDSSGRTSCAKDEREHFRLRCLALKKVVSTLRQDYQSKQAKVVELEDFITRKLGYTDNPDNAAHAALYQKRLLVHQSTAQATKERLARVEAELDFVLEHNSEARVFCELISEKLPTELVDIVYAFVEPYPKELEVDYDVEHKEPLGDESSNQEVVERVYTSKSLNGEFEGKDCKTPWYLDTNIVSPEFAEEKMKTFHRETVFSIDRLVHLTRFLNQNPWRGYEHLVPKEFVRNIHLKIPLDMCHEEWMGPEDSETEEESQAYLDSISGSADEDLEYEAYDSVLEETPELLSLWRLVAGDTLLNELAPLQTLTQRGVRITIDVRPSMRTWSLLLPKHIMEAWRDSSHEGPFKYEGGDEAENEWENTEDFELIGRLLLLVLMQKLLPFFQDLVKKGQVVTILDGREKWSWVMSRDSMSMDDLLECRQAFWAQKPEGVFGGEKLEFRIPALEDVGDV
ncbi:uncharacterized protein J4E84_010068 [Alternaria hordeiaustralica]|uniref:uncharacterized protein n=1 Tax=Alternaria hordeiaustralica TaxID=1187925 RepID=UPI0020C5AE2B|nr:uncharacterized protein J4E84_010068 [Alternaria hordeiaustralica]KAI4675473.1 hypothetical protein J4E84_010068 [Alternaria hordeiaustralica]